MIKGKVYKNGKVTITWNEQRESLPAPSVGGIPHKYLPCDMCGVVQSVESHVVSTLCDVCYVCQEG